MVSVIEDTQCLQEVLSDSLIVCLAFALFFLSGTAGSSKSAVGKFYPMLSLGFYKFIARCSVLGSLRKLFVWTQSLGMLSFAISRSLGGNMETGLSASRMSSVRLEKHRF